MEFRYGVPKYIPPFVAVEAPRSVVWARGSDSISATFRHSEASRAILSTRPLPPTRPPAHLGYLPIEFRGGLRAPYGIFGISILGRLGVFIFICARSGSLGGIYSDRVPGNCIYGRFGRNLILRRNLYNGGIEWHKIGGLRLRRRRSVAQKLRMAK